MTWLRDVVYKLKRTGPRTYPCGTLNRRCCGQDSVPDMLILWCLCEKYDLNHRRAVPEMQNVYENVKGLNDQSCRKQLRDQLK